MPAKNRKKKKQQQQQQQPQGKRTPVAGEAQAQAQGPARGLTEEEEAAAAAAAGRMSALPLPQRSHGRDMVVLRTWHGLLDRLQFGRRLSAEDYFHPPEEERGGEEEEEENGKRRERTGYGAEGVRENCEATILAQVECASNGLFTFVMDGWILMHHAVMFGRGVPLLEAVLRRTVGSWRADIETHEDGGDEDEDEDGNINSAAKVADEVLAGKVLRTRAGADDGTTVFHIAGSNPYLTLRMHQFLVEHWHGCVEEEMQTTDSDGWSPLFYFAVTLTDETAEPLPPEQFNEIASVACDIVQRLGLGALDVQSTQDTDRWPKGTSPRSMLIKTALGRAVIQQAEQTVKAATAAAAGKTDSAAASTANASASSTMLGQSATSAPPPAPTHTEATATATALRHDTLANWFIRNTDIRDRERARTYAERLTQAGMPDEATLQRCFDNAGPQVLAELVPDAIVRAQVMQALETREAASTA